LIEDVKVGKIIWTTLLANFFFLGTW
jgi:hypothetical protein